MSNVLQMYRLFSLYFYRLTALFLFLSLSFFQESSLYAQPQFKSKATQTEQQIDVEVVKIYSGPSIAYAVKGKAFKGNVVKILRFSSDQTWVEIQTPQFKGWILSNTLSASSASTVHNEDDLGRENKKSNYQYDENGKRMNAQDQTEHLAASAKKIKSQAPSSFKTTAKPYLFRLSLLPGMTQLSRAFSSDIAYPSPLQKITATGLVYQTSIKGEFLIHEHFGLSFDFQDARMSIALAPHRDSISQKETNLQMDRQNANLLLHGSYQVSDFKFSLLTGIQIQRSYIQQIKESSLILQSLNKNPDVTYLPFLQHLSVILPVGLKVKYQIDPAWYLALEGGVWLPLSLSQAPTNSGKWSGFGGWTDLVLGWDFSDMLGLSLAVHWNQLVYAYTGPGTHSDPIAQQRYQNSMSSDSSMGASLGLTLRF